MDYRKEGISALDMPLFALNKLLILSGLAFLSGVFLTIAFFQY